MATTMHDPLAGRILDGRYRIVDRIATGGMATVYRAVDIRLERPVAVKVLHATWAADPQARLRFQREARAAAALSHPDVVAVHDAGADDGEPFLVMEYVAGATLRDVIRDRLRLGAGEAVAVMDHVLAALGAAHRIGLVHRDVKPENVLVTPDGRVKVADFGLARAIADASITTTASGLIGTAAYLAPEQWTGQPVDARTDVYAAGTVLFELLTGSPPFTGEPPVVMRRHLEDSVPPPSSYAPGIPPALDRLVTWATEREPADRPRDADELHGVLLSEARHDGLTLAVPALPVSVTETIPAGTERIDPTAPVAGSGTAPVVTPPGGPGRTASARTRHRRWPWVTLLVLLLAAAAAVLGWWLAVGRYVDAPNLLNATKADAVARLHRLGLQADILAPQFSPTYDKGHIAYESPGPGQGVVRGGTVQLAVSKGPREFAMPGVRDMPRGRAVALLKGWDLKVSVQTRYDGTVRPSRAIGTEPASGVKVNAGQQVTLLVSKGHAPVTIPGVSGSDPGAASQELTGKGFVVGTTRQVYDDTIPAGKVVRTNPAAGTTRPFGSTVDLVVSKGPKLYAVPDVTDQPIGKAVRTLRAAGFDPQPHEVLPGGPGVVLKQDPGGNSMQPRGTTVALDYY